MPDAQILIQEDATSRGYPVGFHFELSRKAHQDRRGCHVICPLLILSCESHMWSFFFKLTVTSAESNVRKTGKGSIV